MIEFNEQCKSCFHFQVCANVLKQQLLIREKMLKEENPMCEQYIPTADFVEVKHGYWVHTDKADHWYVQDECSECYYHTYDRTDLSHFSFCPNCGAKMDGSPQKEVG